MEAGSLMGVQPGRGGGWECVRMDPELCTEGKV